MNSYHGNAPRDVDDAEREAIAAAVVADFLDALGPSSRRPELRRPMTIGQLRKLAFLKHLVSTGKVGR